MQRVMAATVGVGLSIRTTALGSSQECGVWLGVQAGGLNNTMQRRHNAAGRGSELKKNIYVYISRAILEMCQEKL